jgi:hypothetical protein
MPVTKRLILVAYLLVIWLLFIAGALICFLAPVVSIALVIIHPSLRQERIQNIVRAMDRLNAALLGWSGLNTISGECGRDNCRFCAALCRILNAAEPDHCRKTAINEGLIKEGNTNG